MKKQIKGNRGNNKRSIQSRFTAKPLTRTEQRHQAPQLFSLSPATEWDRWLIGAGISPESSMGVNQIGIYTDFN